MWIFQLYMEGYIDLRCPHCGEIYNYHVEDDVVTDMTIGKHKSSIYVRTLKLDHYLYKDYTETNLLYHHKETIKCNHCGGEWEHYYKSAETIDSQDDGMHIEITKYI